MTSPSHEHSLLSKLHKYCNFTPSHRYPIDIGDDAVIRRSSPSESLIFTADSFVETVHFSRKYMTLEQVGYKALAINISDCAAMGAAPESALVSLLFPAKATEKEFIELYKGLDRACKQFNLSIIGGNLSQAPCWIIDVTLIGSQKKNKRSLLRTAIKPTDALWVSGHPGQSAAGLAVLERLGKKALTGKFKELVFKHIEPTPQVSLGQLLAADKNVHAAMDLSDGISKDSRTLCYENNLSLTIDQAFIPSTILMRDCAHALKTDWLNWFLHGGEDYELLFATTDSWKPTSAMIKAAGGKLTRIGTFSKAGKELLLKVCLENYCRFQIKAGITFRHFGFIRFVQDG